MTFPARQGQCIVCDSNQWLPFRSPHPTRSVRSDGAVLAQPLLKAQCDKCALVQSQEVPNTDTLATLFTDSYDIYNNRPASEHFVTNRYTALAEAITSAVLPYHPKHVLEVGCGNGAALKAVQTLWHDAVCIGIEPTATAVKAAQALGLNVHQAMIGVDVPENIASNKYDVIYCIHVIEHTQDPVAFLKELIKMLSPYGRIVVSCPNSRVPNLELTRSDHHFSMTPYHLDSLVRKAGLVPLKNTTCPGGAENLDDEHNQLMVCALPEIEGTYSEAHLPEYLSPPNRKQLFETRNKYFSVFSAIDDALQSSLGDAERVFCFGSGGWACILAGYAPRTWDRVKACIIDGGSEYRFHGKAILAYEDLKKLKPDKVIIGTNPAIQAVIAQRLAQDGISEVRWDHLIVA